MIPIEYLVTALIAVLTCCWAYIFGYKKGAKNAYDKLIDVANSCAKVVADTTTMVVNFKKGVQEIRAEMARYSGDSTMNSGSEEVKYSED